MMNYRFFIFLTLFFFHSTGCMASWIEHWNQAVKLTDQNKYAEAISAYTKAIVESPQDKKHLYLFNERGNARVLNHLCLGSETDGFEKAISDFTFVIDYSDVGKQELMDALQGRARALLLSGKPKQFEADFNRLNDIEPQILEEEITPQYEVVKIGNMFLKDPNGLKSIKTMYVSREDVETEKDVIGTPSGRFIIKKKQPKTLEPSQE